MLVYLAHPVGSDPVEREFNLARAERWFVWLLSAFPYDAIVVPWLPYVRNLEETPVNRRRGIQDDLEVLRRCDAIALVGGRLSPGMAAELEEAREYGLIVEDLLHLGEEPPV